MKRWRVRARQWARYVERIPRDSKTPPGYWGRSRVTYPVIVTLRDGGDPEPAYEAARQEQQELGLKRPRPVPILVRVRTQGRRR